MTIEYDGRRTADDVSTYTIGELAELAEVTPRTIRYYTSEGLLPPPDTQAKYARYNGDHLARLRLIARLKNNYLPLHEIRARIVGLDTDGVHMLLAEVQPQRQIAEASSAADYIAAVTAKSQMQIPAANAPAAGAPPASAPRAGFFRPFAPAQHAEPAPAAPAAETWRRIVLAPGVELHLREPNDRLAQDRIEVLIARVQTLFDSEETE